MKYVYNDTKGTQIINILYLFQWLRCKFLFVHRKRLFYENALFMSTFIHDVETVLQPNDGKYCYIKWKKKCKYGWVSLRWIKKFNEQGTIDRIRKWTIANIKLKNIGKIFDDINDDVTIEDYVMFNDIDNNV